MYVSLFIGALTLCPSVLLSQGVGINTSGANPNAAAILDIASTNRGMLTPRMTQAQRNAIPGPATGLLIYQTDNRPGFRFYDGTDWVFLRAMTSVPGRVEIATGCVESIDMPSSYAGFSVSYDCTNGTGTVSWPVGIFNDEPAVNLSSSVVPVPPAAPDIYCVPTYSADCNTAFNADQITGVRINEGPSGGPYTNIMDRSSGCEGIADGNYIDVPTGTATATLSGNTGGVCTGNYYTVEIRSSTEWTDYVQAWIDWNADGDFYDAQEHLSPTPFFGTSNGNWVSSDEFSVPAFALNGSTVMRCRSIFTSNSDPCNGATFGETEDYTLTIDCANTGPAPEITSICTVTDVTATSFDYKCSLLSGSPASPPLVNFDLVPLE